VPVTLLDKAICSEMILSAAARDLSCEPLMVGVLN